MFKKIIETSKLRGEDKAKLYKKNRYRYYLKDSTIDGYIY